MNGNIDWYCGDDVYILIVEPKSDIVFNMAFSKELERFVGRESRSIYPKVAFAMKDGCLYVKNLDTEGFMVIHNLEYGNAILCRGEANTVIEKFGDEIFGEWRFEKLDGYFKGRKINKSDTESGVISIVK
jgi:hypothetical protein